MRYQNTHSTNITQYNEEATKLKNLYRQVNTAMIEKDTKTLRKLIKPNTELIHMTGYHQTIEEWFEQIESEEMKYYSWSEDHISIEYIDDTSARLIGQSKVKARIWGSGPTTWRLQIVMSFEKQNGNWMIVKQVASTY